jgi:hypothetical protein
VFPGDNIKLFKGIITRNATQQKGNNPRVVLGFDEICQLYYLSAKFLIATVIYLVFTRISKWGKPLFEPFIKQNRFSQILFLLVTFISNFPK